MRTPRAAALVLALAASACATAPQTASLVENPGALPDRAAVADVPFFPQEKYYCGPAAVAMTLAWTGLPVDQDDLAPQVYTPGRKGTLQPDVIAALRRNGRMAVPVESLPDMLAEIAGGRPVLVFQNLGLSLFPQWHYAVAKGYDLPTRELILHSGTIRDYRVALDTFERTWARGGYWALVVLNPGELPLRASELAVLKAAAGLERAAQLDAAATAYVSVTVRWPDSFAAWLGLGNVRYALKDLPGAEAAFRIATEVEPEDPAPAWNNLAYVLAALGRKEEAIAAARKAVETGDADDPNYRASLEEISNM